MHLRSIIIAAVQTIGLFVCGFLIPLLAWMVTPVPLILVYFRSSRWDGLAALGLFCLIASFLGGWHIGLFLLLMFGLIAVGVSEGLVRLWKPEHSILLGTLPLVGIIGSIATYYFISINKNPVTVLETFFHGQREEAMKLYSGLGFNEIASTVSSIPDSSIHYFVLLLPCIATLTIAAIACCSYVIARTFIVRKPGSGPALTPIPFASWHIPDTWIWGLIASLALFLIPDETAKFVGWNFLILFATVYLAQGSALVDHFLKEKIHMGGISRALISIVILLLPPLIVSVIALGVMDIWIDSRKLRAPAENKQ